MAVYSMTGYAAVQQGPTGTGGGGSARTPRIGLEIRAVNSRFLDLSLRLPDELRAHETALRELLTRELRRGKVELRVSIDGGGDTELSEPTPALLQRLSSLQDQVRVWLPEARPLSVADALRLAGSARAPLAVADLETVLMTLARDAVAALREARGREGERLARMLQDRLAQLRALADQAEPLIPQLVVQQRQRFLERWRDALGAADAGVSPESAQERALSEATAFAIRIDVAEEVTRLRAHIDELGALIAKGGEIGKRLDFLIQELHREANTLGSKSAALELTRISVDMKVLIEQMREQVQNIE